MGPKQEFKVSIISAVHKLKSKLFHKLGAAAAKQSI